MAVVITGNNTPTAGGVTYGDGTTYATTTAGTSGQALLSGGAGAPTWGTPASSTTATNLAGGSAGTVPYQSASGTTAMLAAGSSGQVLTSSGAGAPTWSTPSSGAMVYISTINASAASTVDVEGIDSTYDYYIIVATGVYGSVNTALLANLKLNGAYRASEYYSHLMRPSSGSTAYSGATENSGQDIRILDSNPASASERSNFIMEILDPSGENHKSVMWRGMSWGSGGASPFYNYVGTAGHRDQNGPLTGVRFKASGTITGTFRLYGVKKS